MAQGGHGIDAGGAAGGQKSGDKRRRLQGSGGHRQRQRIVGLGFEEKRLYQPGGEQDGGNADRETRRGQQQRFAEHHPDVAAISEYLGLVTLADCFEIYRPSAAVGSAMLLEFPIQLDITHP